MEEISLNLREAPRLLQAGNSTAALTQTEVIRSTCMIYVSVFVALFVAFLLLRPRYPRVYNIKKSFPALHAPVADDPFGALSWIWRVFEVGYDQIREECGMDAASAIRLMELGARLSLVGVFNSVFLVPVYAVMGDVVGAADPVRSCSLSNLGQGHHGAYATAVAAWVFFLAAMRMVDKDFEWFTYHRHKFLSGRRAQNYSVYLSGLPPGMQADAAVRAYFDNCFAHEAVSDVHVALVIPELEKKVAKRDKLLPKLEHSQNILDVKGKVPKHKTKQCGGETVETIPAYTKDIEDLDAEISADISRIQALQADRDARFLGGSDVDAGGTEQSLAEENWGDGPGLQPLGASLADYTTSVAAGASALKSLVLGDEDGAPRNACFVSFANLGSANLARQAVHNQEPWDCVPAEPPMPHLVNWKNVGMSNARRQIGELVSFLLTAVLCVFWSIPVTFVASLSNAEELANLIPPLKAPLANYKWFSSLLAVLAPLILVAFISLLPYIILSIIKLEGLIEIESLQHPSLFAKLGFFTIIQTFFISTIASTLFSSIQEMLSDPTSAIFLLSKALPAQSAYFIQIIIVQNLLALGIELLRISPIVQNIARKIVAGIFGHNLTEKERSETFFGLRSLDDPLEYYFGRELGSKIILMQMVLYVYGCMAPITSYFTLLIFALLAIGFRHQFIFIYPPGNDSGGKLWLNYTRLSVTLMIVAEIVLCAVLLLKEAFIPAVLLVPLVLVTILFDIYFKRRHYAITSYLPLGDCALVDGKNKREGIGSEWLKGAYLHPALKERSDPQDLESQASLDRAADLADEHKRKGDSYMARKEYDLALGEYSRAIGTSPSGRNSYIYYYNRAATHCYRGAYSAAVTDCRTSIDLNPEYAKAHMRLGVSLYFQGDYGGAVNAYKKSLDLDPHDQECFNYMVKAREKLDVQADDETVTVHPLHPIICGRVNCLESSSKSTSFDPSITNDD